MHQYWWSKSALIQCTSKWNDIVHSICLTTVGETSNSVEHTAHYIIFKVMGYNQLICIRCCSLRELDCLQLQNTLSRSYTNSLSTRFDTFLFTTLTSRRNIKWTMSHRQKPTTQHQIVSTPYGRVVHTTQIFQRITHKLPFSGFATNQKLHTKSLRWFAPLACHTKLLTRRRNETSNVINAMIIAMRTHEASNPTNNPSGPKMPWTSDCNFSKYSFCS